MAVVLWSTAAAASDKPPLAPDAVAPFTTESRISAAVEFGLPALASKIEQSIPRRLATIDERVACVNRRVIGFRVQANCDVDGYVERSGRVSIYGRDGRVYGSVPIYGALEAQGANRFTSRIRGETEASATVEAEARPRLTKDWALALNFSDRFSWSEPPVMRVLGREISLTKYAEPRIRSQLAKIRSRANAAARSLDLKGKAAAAWRHAFDPIALSDTPPVWLQLTPQAVSFAGVSADSKVLRGSLELRGSAMTTVGQQPPAVEAAPLPPLGNEVSAPGELDVILPVRIGYDVLKQKLSDILAATPIAGLAVRDLDIYPSSGKLIIGLRLDKPSDEPATENWVYVSAGVVVAADGQSVALSDLAVITPNDQLALLITNLQDKARIDFGPAYQNLLKAANDKLNRPLQNGFRLEGHLASAKLEKLYLPADGVVVAMRATGRLRILYGM
ncbi:DUF4403 family protein [Rhodopseudomonas palustris]|nr:DUF4403 family protein [Rhodopseudomonas palustris]